MRKRPKKAQVIQSEERKIVSVQGAWGTLTFTLDCGHIAHYQVYGAPTKTIEEYQEKQAAWNARYQGQAWNCLACPGEAMRQQLRATLAALDEQLAEYEPEKPMVAACKPQKPAKEKSAQKATMEPEQAQSITRTVYTRPVTFKCQWCHQTVTEDRFPSHMPLYCQNSACKQAATRAKTRERVANWRKSHPDARRKQKA